MLRFPIVLLYSGKICAVFPKLFESSISYHRDFSLPGEGEHSLTPYAYVKKTPSFAHSLDFSRSHVAMHTVVHEESESEVGRYRILEPGGKILETYPKNSRVSFLFEKNKNDLI